jgi:hypothetical protein
VFYARAVDARAVALADPSEQNRALWRDARTAWFDSLAMFFSDKRGEALYSAFETLLAQEGLSRENSDGLIRLRDSLLAAYENAKGLYVRAAGARTALETELLGAWCILGGTGDAAVQGTALLADSVILGRALSIFPWRWAFLWPLAASALAALLLAFVGPLAALIAGALATAGVSAGIAVLFTRSGWYMPPLAVVAGMGAATFISAALAWTALGLRMRRLRGVLRPYMAGRLLKAAVRNEARRKKPLTGGAKESEALIVAIKNAELSKEENSLPPELAAKAYEAFRGDVRAVFLPMSAVFAGSFGDLIAVRFTKETMEAEGFSLALILEKVAANENTAGWTLGLDYGPVATGWSESTGGLAAWGRPVIHARLLAGLCGKYQAAALVTQAVHELPAAADLSLTKLDAIRSKDGAYKETFYKAEK